MTRSTISYLVLGATLLGACAEDRATMLEPAEVAVSNSKEGGGGGGGTTSECGAKTALADSRASLDWGTTNAIRNDDHGAYVGNVNGVHAKIFYHDGNCSRSGDMVFDADMNQKNGPRRLVFVFPAENPAGVPAGEYEDAPFVNFRQLMQLGSDVNGDGWVNEATGATGGRDQKIEEKNPGALRGLEYPDLSADRPTYPAGVNGDAAPMFRIGTSAPGCETLEYESIHLKRTKGVEGFQPTGQNASSDGLPMGQWSAEIMGEWVVSGENARCWHTVKGKLELKDETFFSMPFSVTVTETR